MKTKDIYRLANKEKKNFSVFTAVIVAFLLIYCVALIGLIFWGAMTSFKDDALEFSWNKAGLPKEWVLSNYKMAFEGFTVPREAGMAPATLPSMFLYGFLYAIGSAFFGTLVPCIVGYMCARFNYKFSKVIYTIVIVAMILPIIGNLPAEIRTARTLHLFNQIWGVWIMKANFLGMYFLVFYNFFKSLPEAYSEAAKIDGAGNFRILFKVILPLATPLFSTVMLIYFITFWNDYQTPMVYLSNYPTISLGVYLMRSGGLDGIIMPPTVQIATSILVLVPVLIVFLVFHKKLLGNLTVGGIKG